MNEADLRKQAWDFFQMQATQRLTTFNFYIALSSLISGGLAANLKAQDSMISVGVLLGLLLALFSFVFWKLDQRNRDLIKSAEDVLKFFENKAQFEDEKGRPHIVKRFAREEYDTNYRRTRRSWRLWSNHYSYSDCFQIVFLTFGAVGILGAGYSTFCSILKA